MEFLVQNWFLIVALIAIIVVAITYVRKFVQLSPEEQKKNVRAWLLFAVSMAEKEFSESGMGKIKLRSVYSQFLTLFPWLAKVISFAEFSLMVDEALEEMEQALKDNKGLSNFINGVE